MHHFFETIAIKRYQNICCEVNHLDGPMRDLPDEALMRKYQKLRRRRREGADLSDLLPTAFAIVREACRRTIGIRQYDLQIQAGAALVEGKVVEMKTGEGKTFVAPLAAALLALDPNGVHILTANDYLAGRDAEKLRPAYEMIGLHVGCVLADTPASRREQAYKCDVTYTTVVQLGFDFLRDYFRNDPKTLRQNDIWKFMRSNIDGTTRENRCLRGRHCCILDEVDSLLIDYARRPLSLSVQAENQHPPEVYRVTRNFVLTELTRDRDFEVDEVNRDVELTDEGIERVKSLQNEYSYLNLLSSEWEARVEEAISAELLFEKGVHYVLQNNCVCLVDQSSGRLMSGQRLGGELHQALEAKENVPIQPRQTVAKKITIQSLLRPYKHLAGMTGTAWEARREFQSVYNMKTVRFPPRLEDQTDVREPLLFSDNDARWRAVTDEIETEHAAGRPVLVGTRSVKSSEKLSDMLDQRGISHQLLNAVNEASEAEIIANAGEKGHVTVAAHMAGRGVEIALGDGVKDLGGMHVIATEFHPLHRMDRQLAGRTGRRGQPGSVRFFGCVEDDVFKSLTEREGKRLRALMPDDDRPVDYKEVSSFIEKAQRRFARHFAQVRKKLLSRDLMREEGERILFGQDKL
jgi:preprotein translocase subunit SecA